MVAEAFAVRGKKGKAQWTSAFWASALYDVCHGPIDQEFHIIKPRVNVDGVYTRVEAPTGILHWGLYSITTTTA